jgi:hypothetical protein
MTEEPREALSAVVGIVASVGLRGEAEKQAMVERFRHSHWAQQPGELASIERDIRDPTMYTMEVTLSADLLDGRRVIGGGFSFGGSRHGIAAIWHRYRGAQLSGDPEEHDRLLHQTYHVGLADIEDAVNQMLGRDPDQHRPPRLSWSGLQRALTEAGIEADEDELIAAPLTVKLSPDVKAEIVRES